MILNQIILQSQDLILMKLIVMARNGLFYLEKAEKLDYIRPSILTGEHAFRSGHP